MDEICQVTLPQIEALLKIFASGASQRRDPQVGTKSLTCLQAHYIISTLNDTWHPQAQQIQTVCESLMALDYVTGVCCSDPTFILREGNLSLCFYLERSKC